LCTLQPLYAKSNTVRKGEIVPQGHVCRWITLPTPTANGWTGGKIVIDGSSYDVSASHEVADDGGAFEYVQLRRWDGETYTLCLGRGVEQCSCPHHVYRHNLRCKHIAGVAAAMEALEQIERAAWRADVAQSIITERFTAETI
jgi:hypothetical protein